MNDWLLYRLEQLLGIMPRAPMWLNVLRVTLVSWAWVVLIAMAALWLTGCAQARPGIYSQITIIDLPVGPMPEEQ